MLGETYQIFNGKKFHQFSFISKGPKGGIMKMVNYVHREGVEYNLGFGDIIKGRVVDSVISNNHDLVKIMNTVAKTIYLFFDEYPKYKVYIQAVDKKRLRLYHTILRRKLAEIELNFYLEGLTKEKGWEEFNPKNEYIAFRLSRKF